MIRDKRREPTATRLPARVLVAGAIAFAWHAAACAQDLRVIAPLDAVDGPIGYFIADGEPGSDYRSADRQLAVWALEAWQRSTDGALRFEPAPEERARLRVYWVQANGGQYGEMRPFLIDGHRGAAAFIRPDTGALGPDIASLARADPLLRDTVVYLTCLHELGHALGLHHTDDYRDVMYFFGYGGDIPAFFERYRKQLGSRDDIAHVSGLSAGDLNQLHALYEPH
jgi:hypothetical protein